MKLIFTLNAKNAFTPLAAALLMLMTTITYGQVSTVCTSPATTAYGLTGNGEIYEINSATGATIRVIKNNSYSGNSPSSSNGLGYNPSNGKFYYFKRNKTASPQEFVSFYPPTNIVAALAPSTCTDDIHTGCVSFSGAGYYTVDIQGTLHYYNIAANTWTYITSKLVDQNGNNVSNIVKTQSAGDMTIDGTGNIWLLTSSSSNYGLYKIPAPMPVNPVAQLNVIRVISPTASTPTGNSFAGIAFKPNGQILMATKNDNKLYLLQNTSTLTFVGNLTTSDVGNDLTSCSYPLSTLPVFWKSFDVTLKDNNKVTLNWEVTEFNNKSFYVQHSLNGTDWEDIAFVPSKNSSESSEDYSYSHINNLNGRQYYRIKQVDLDGKTSYSEIGTVMLKNDKQSFTVWPNPVTEQIRISINSGGSNNVHANAQIFDLSGRMFVDKQVEGNTSTINVKDLPAGTYLIKVRSDDGTVYNQKIVKQ
jgi:Secretion system C-terminal sorting domain